MVDNSLSMSLVCGGMSIITIGETTHIADSHWYDAT